MNFEPAEYYIKEGDEFVQLRLVLSQEVPFETELNLMSISETAKREL